MSFERRMGGDRAAISSNDGYGPGTGGTPGKETLTDELVTTSPASQEAMAARGLAAPVVPLPFEDELAALWGDLGDITAHGGEEADAACEGMGARAFAQGKDIVIGANADKETIAHEIAHTRQGRGVVQLKAKDGSAKDTDEVQADEAAKQTSGSAAAPVRRIPQALKDGRFPTSARISDLDRAGLETAINDALQKVALPQGTMEQLTPQVFAISSNAFIKANLADMTSGAFPIGFRVPNGSLSGTIEATIYDAEFQSEGPQVDDSVTSNHSDSHGWTSGWNDTQNVELTLGHEASGLKLGSQQQQQGGTSGSDDSGLSSTAGASYASDSFTAVVGYRVKLTYRSVVDKNNAMEDLPRGFAAGVMGMPLLDLGKIHVPVEKHAMSEQFGSIELAVPRSLK
jgi:hypothetical protein